MAKAYISMGSNLEPRMEHLRAAARALDRPPLKLSGLSALYETEPVGVEDQPLFLNAMAAVETALGPEALLARLQEIEREAKKKVAYRWGPRTLDLDLVLYGMETRDTADLVLPHPRMHERSFVLVPLCELDPGGKKTERYTGA